MTSCAPNTKLVYMPNSKLPPQHALQPCPYHQPGSRAPQATRLLQPLSRLCSASPPTHAPTFCLRPAPITNLVHMLPKPPSRGTSKAFIRRLLLHGTQGNHRK